MIYHQSEVQKYSHPAVDYEGNVYIRIEGQTNSTTSALAWSLSEITFVLANVDLTVMKTHVIHLRQPA